MKPVQLNPQDTAVFVENMRRLNPNDQADVAMKWRERAVNAVAALNPGPIGTSLEVLGGSAYGAGIGAWDGVNEARRAALIDQWRSTTAPSLNISTVDYPEPFQKIAGADGTVIFEGVSDPRTWLGLNKAAWPTIGLVLTGLGLAFTSEGMRAAAVITTVATSGAAYLLGTTMRDTMYKRERDRIATKGALAAGPATNPRGWRRAA